MTAKIDARVAVVTGARSGIGREAAKALAAAGWRVMGLGRDPERSATALIDIRASAAAGQDVDMIIADLSLMADVAGAAQDLAARTDRVDVLLNTEEDKHAYRSGNIASGGGDRGYPDAAANLHQ